MPKNKSRAIRKEMREMEFSFVFKEMSFFDKIILIFSGSAVFIFLSYVIIDEILTYVLK